MPASVAVRFREIGSDGDTISVSEIVFRFAVKEVMESGVRFVITSLLMVDEREVRKIARSKLRVLLSGRLPAGLRALVKRFRLGVPRLEPVHNPQVREICRQKRTPRYEILCFLDQGCVAPFGFGKVPALNRLLPQPAQSHEYAGPVKRDYDAPPQQN